MRIARPNAGHRPQFGLSPAWVAPWTLLGVVLGTGACVDERASHESAPVYATEIAPLFEKQCQSCHSGESPAGGFRTTSFLDAIGCNAEGAPATLPANDTAPVVRVLGTGVHVGLLRDAERDTLLSWVRAGAPAFHAGVHPPGIVDPRSPDWHGKTLRAQRWAQMLDPNHVEACGRCHDGAPVRPAGIKWTAPGATACTSCHTEPEGVLACGTCHGRGTQSYAPRDACFFPSSPGESTHLAHLAPSPANPKALLCSTCHPMPGSEIIGGLHGNRSVEIIFDSAVIGPEVSYDRTTGQCAVSCHDHGGARTRLAWTEKGPLGCGDCHGSPPAAHYPGLCTQCHAEPNATGTQLTAQKLHFNGRVDLGDGSGGCGACHGKGDDPGPATGAHLAHRQPKHTTPIACTTCHVVPKDIHDPGHLDGKVLVTFSGHAVDRGATPAWNGTACTTVACHGEGIRTPRVVPVWTDTSGAASACDACHGAPPTLHTPSTACDRSGCHGTEIIRAGSSLAISESGKTFHIDGVINPVPP